MFGVFVFDGVFVDLVSIVCRANSFCCSARIFVLCLLLRSEQPSVPLLKRNVYFSSGEVELENLPLKREALRHIGLPVEIKAGFIGKVRLQVPVRQIRTASWVLVIEQLYLVAGPISLNEVHRRPFLRRSSMVLFVHKITAFVVRQ